MSGQHTISQLAKAAGIPTTTLRYYERIGLVEPEDRSSGNYRLYGDESLRKLNFIRAAQTIGFTLDDIRTLLGYRSGKTPSCHDVQELIEVRLTDIDRRMRDLRQVQKVLQSSLQKCRNSAKAHCCHVIETLQAKR